MLLEINRNEKISWKGKLRPSVEDKGVYPRPYQEELPIWIAAGGTPASAVRAANLGLPLALAIIGGMPEQFVPFFNLYRQATEKAGKDVTSLKTSINSHVYVADSSEQASNEFYIPYANMMNHIGKERGWSPLSREQFEYMRSPKGSLLVGSPAQVVDKILYEHELFGNTRFLAQMSVGHVPHQQILHSIELFGTKVAPEVRKALHKS